jgi:hypothetical protein
MKGIHSTQHTNVLTHTLRIWMLLTALAKNHLMVCSWAHGITDDGIVDSDCDPLNRQIAMRLSAKYQKKFRHIPPFEVVMNWFVLFRI